MERNYMKPDTLVELDFITEKHLAFHSHENFELLFVISGKMLIMLEEDSYQLSAGDLIIININRKHSYNGNQEFVAGRFVISYSKVRELLGQENVLFWCNSSVDHNDAFDNLRKIIVKIFNQAIQKTNQNKLYINSLYYQMLHVLTGNFLLSAADLQYEQETGEDDRLQKIFTFIRTNYRENITLNDVAKQLFLSPTYVSKYIKKKSNINFIELVNTVRLSRAMDDLMYTDDSIMKIALENGFSSVVAYNKTFKEAHQTTPSEFRKKYKQQKQKKNDLEGEERLLVKQKFEKYLDTNRNLQNENAEKNENSAIADMDILCQETWNGYASKMINVGVAKDLLNAIFQEQILVRKNLMGFEYIRFWDIYAPEMYLDINQSGDKQNYSRLNAILDFIVKNQLHPYIELGFKKLRIHKNVNIIVKQEKKMQDFKSEVEMRAFFRGLIKHLVRRYGTKEVEKWYFEYWEETDLQHNSDESQYYVAMAEKVHKEYFRRFSSIALELRNCLPTIKIGGGGFPVRLYGENGFAQILTVWKQELQKPDFISLSCYPYIQEITEDSYYEKRTTDMEFVKHNIEMTRKAMKMAEFPAVELHVTEYSFSLSNRNVINDSCFKSAFLMYTMISCLKKVDIMGYWLFTDAYSDGKDVHDILFGGCGLLTKDGITKPAYYAFEFIHRLYEDIIARSPNYLITRNKQGSIRLICHNMKKLNYNYYIAEENQLEIKDMSVILDDREFLLIHFQIKNVTNGIYKIKKNQLNKSGGSVQDRWISLNMESNLTMREMDYLKNTSVSAITIQGIEVTDGTLDFTMELEPNEIDYIHILIE